MFVGVGNVGGIPEILALGGTAPADGPAGEASTSTTRSWRGSRSA
jgi:hypothetical protein